MITQDSIKKHTAGSTLLLSWKVSMSTITVLPLALLNYLLILKCSNIFTCVISIESFSSKHKALTCCIS